MKNEKKVQNELDQKQTENVTGNVAETAPDEQENATRYKYPTYNDIPVIPDLQLEREPFMSNGKTMYAYKVHGVFLGKDVRIELTAGSYFQNGKSYTDSEVYAQLDNVFEMFDDRRFGVKVYDDGKSKKTVEYYVIGVAPNGVAMPVPVKITRPGSISKLATLLSDIAVKYNAKPINII